MQRSGEENTDGDGVEQDLFQKNNLRQNPRPPGCQCEKKISSFAWSVGDRVYFIKKE